MSDNCRKSVWPWIVALLIGLPVLYVASFGPACWLCDRDHIPDGMVNYAYRPLVACLVRCGFVNAARRYGELLPTPQPPPNPTPFGHSSWRMPKAQELLFESIVENYTGRL
jgi:hypothetical protein